MGRKCLSADPSSFDKRVAVQALTQLPDGQGGFTETYATVATVWASLEPLKAYERTQAMQAGAPVTHKVVMRYTPQATAARRLAWNGRTFHVAEVLNLGERNAFLELRAVEAA